MSTRSALDLSTRSIKIYSGAADAQARADIAEHEADNENPHQVTKAQVGLSAADNTSDAAKPVSTAQAAALALKAPLDSPALFGSPTAPTAPVGTVGNQVATVSFVAAAVTAVDVPGLSDDLDAHLADHANPHIVTKAQVGLALADNTADASKPVSGPQQTAINAAAAIGTAAQADVDGHQADVANPHSTTKAQVGLGSVDNTADLAKPISSAQQVAINAASAAAAAAQADIDAHEASTSNPHSVSKIQVGLGSVDNTADLAKPISTATAAALALKAPIASPSLTGTPLSTTAAPGTNTTQIATTAFAKAAVDASATTLTAAIALKAPLASPALTGTPTAPTAPGGTSSTQIATTAFADAIGDALTASLGVHITNVSNPHGTTKAQVGLGAVDNTSDLAKPVSTATQAAINAAIAGSDAVADDLTAHLADHANPHVVTKTQIGLPNVDNTSDAAKPVSAATQTQLNLKAPLASPALTGVPTAPTAAPGTNTTQIASTAYAKAAADAVAANVTAHAANVSNPHSVTKTQIGLPNVDNTSDANKPVSTAQQTAINAASAAAAAAQTDIDGHQANVSNPHSTTKAQVGLGAVDNTSDANKPVSTAQAAALALKAPLLSPALTGTPIAPTAVAGTNTTQIATTAYVTAAIALKAPLASPALTGVPTAPTAAPGTATTQIATTQFVELVTDALRASIDGAAGDAGRPGDAVALYGTLATGTAAAMPRVDPTWVATSAAGNVIRVNSVTADDPQVIAPAGAFTVGPVYDVTFTVQRQTDPIDPLNDSVTLAIRWLTNTYAGVAGATGISTIANLPLVIANGVVTQRARIGGGGLVPPAGAVYFRPYVQLFGNNHVTDVIVLDVDTGCGCLPFVTDITGTATLVPGAAGLVLVTAAAPLTVTLPPLATKGQTITIKDSGGTAGASPITIDGGVPNIEDANTLVLNMNFSWATLAYNGSQWVQV